MMDEPRSGEGHVLWRRKFKKARWGLDEIKKKRPKQKTGNQPEKRLNSERASHIIRMDLEYLLANHVTIVGFDYII